MKNFTKVQKESFTRSGKATLKKKINNYIDNEMPQIAELIKKEAKWFYGKIENIYLFLRYEDKNESQEITDQEVKDAIMFAIGEMILSTNETK